MDIGPRQGNGRRDLGALEEFARDQLVELCARVGVHAAVRTLGVAMSTLRAARDGRQVSADTRVRIARALTAVGRR